MDSVKDAYASIAEFLQRIPGSEVVWRYIEASHQNDPARTLLEVLLLAFVLRTWAQSRTRGDSRDRSFIPLDEHEVDELVKEWTPEPLVKAPSKALLPDPPVIVGPPSMEPTVRNDQGVERKLVNLASPNFAGFLGDSSIKQCSIDTLKYFGVGSCGPSGFYGTFDVHMDLERDLAQFLGVESSIIYSQSFSTPSSVIPTFSKRGDLIIADKGVNFSLQKGVQVSRSTVKWFNHGDYDDLERILAQIAQEDQRHKRKLTRRFIVTEGLFENDGTIANLPRLMELKHKYKYRIILDETWSFGVLGKTGRGLTEHYGIPAQDVDIITGSMTTAFSTAGGFCAGAANMVAHQRINSPSYVFSAALPPMVATTSSLALSYFTDSAASINALGRSHPLENVAEYTKIIRNAIKDIPSITVPSNEVSPIIHVYVRNPREHSQFGELSFRDREELDLQAIVDDCFNKGLFISRCQRLWKYELSFDEPSATRQSNDSSKDNTPSKIYPSRPSIRICVSGALSREQVNNAASILSQSIQQVLS